jgi:FkbM family methyltransferase
LGQSAKPIERRATSAQGASPYSGNIDYPVTPTTALKRLAAGILSQVGLIAFSVSCLATGSIYQLARRGYRLVRQGPLDNLVVAEFLRKLLGLLEVDLVIDVGANVGQYRDFLRRDVGYEGPIVSFEPIPWHVETLRQRARSDPRWHIEGCALGMLAGRASFNVMAESQFSSFLTPDHTVIGRFEEVNRVKTKVDVEVRRLDDVFADIDNRYGCRRPYLKIDTQGFDLEVIAGAEASLARICALQTEASVKRIYAGAPDYARTIEILQDKGFELSGIFNNNPSAHFPLLIEFDCFMIARKHALKASQERDEVPQAALP